jgi:hypothetical protein
MPRRLIRLGIDYGTSFSKIVFRDYGAPGGEKAYVMFRDNNFRIPSAVGVTSSELIFGESPSPGGEDGVVWHESIKMRFAGEVKGDLGHYCFGPIASLPDTFSARDLVMLTVWHLISEGIKAIREHLKDNSKDVFIGFSMGIPMSFYNDPALKLAFVDVARAAWELSKGLLAARTTTFREAHRLLEFAYESVSENGALSEDEIRDWLRTEAEAALWWPFQSPSIGEGPYAQIDIGAGTTNISVFRIVPKMINGHWTKERIAFFGADSPPIGMDAVDKALALWKRDSNESCLSLRGEERTLFKTRGAFLAISDVLRKIHQAYRDTLRRAFATHLQGHYEHKSWMRHKIFFIGGGSQIEALVEELRKSPIVGNEKNSHEAIFQDKPADLMIKGKSQTSVSLLPHIAVAYGLSNLAADLPRAEAPNEIPPMAAIDMRPRNFQPLWEPDE